MSTGAGHQTAIDQLHREPAVQEGHQGTTGAGATAGRHLHSGAGGADTHPRHLLHPEHPGVHPGNAAGYRSPTVQFLAVPCEGLTVAVFQVLFIFHPLTSVTVFTFLLFGLHKQAKREVYFTFHSLGIGDSLHFLAVWFGVHTQRAAKFFLA